MVSEVGHGNVTFSRVRGVTRKMSRSLGVAYNRAESAVYDFINGTDTSGKIPGKQLDIPRDITTHITGYQSVNEGHLHRVLRAIVFPDNSTFVDVGCGKGKALLVAARYRFISRLVGLELARSLCAAAERNVDIARARSALRTPVEIVHGDALAYPLSRGENIFFLNNPFDADLMKRFIDLLEESARRDPRQIWILYYNPVHTSMIVQDARFVLVREFRFFGPGRNLAVFQLG